MEKSSMRPISHLCRSVPSSNHLTFSSPSYHLILRGLSSKKAYLLAPLAQFVKWTKTLCDEILTSPYNGETANRQWKRANGLLLNSKKRLKRDGHLCYPSRRAKFFQRESTHLWALSIRTPLTKQGASSPRKDWFTICRRKEPFPTAQPTVAPKRTNWNE